jgi:ribonuclease M5
MNKLKIGIPVIVEGKYDRLRVLSVADATVIATDGFGIFKKSETKTLIKKLSEQCGIIVLTDSDSAGNMIRAYVKNIAAGAEIYNVYVPQIKGKERRKRAPSKEGFLGVEGMDGETIISALKPFSNGGAAPKMTLKKADFYALGLSGKDDSSKKRDDLASLLGLPRGLSASALIEAINLTVSKEEFDAAIKEIEG